MSHTRILMDSNHHPPEISGTLTKYIWAKDPLQKANKWANKLPFYSKGFFHIAGNNKITYPFIRSSGRSIGSQESQPVIFQISIRSTIMLHGPSALPKNRSPSPPQLHSHIFFASANPNIQSIYGALAFRKQWKGGLF